MSHASQHLTQRFESLLTMPRYIKQLLAVGTDAALCVLTVWLAISLRFESWTSLAGYQWLAVLVSIALAIPLLSIFGFYHTVIRFAGQQTISAALRAMAIYTILFSAIFTAYGFPLVPRSIGILQPLLLLLSLGLVRVLVSQLLSEQPLMQSSDAKLLVVLIYGAGRSGQQLAASLLNRGQCKVIAFIDDDTSLHKANIAGIAVYPPSAIHALVQEHGVSDILLAMPSLTRARRLGILKILSPFKIVVRTLPSLSDLASGKFSEHDLREVDIEDLLGRDAVAPIAALMAKNITGKTVLITGAGGSIGSELSRQVCQQFPKKLILLDANEFALYSIQEELLARIEANSMELIAVLANVLDQAHITQVMTHHTPHTIYHAAAYKHVPLVESNALIGLRNNILGTLHVARAALACAAQDMVLISTDKAVRPTNIMGASKRLAEMALQAVARDNSAQEQSTRFCMVRFGNVLGSSGSVVPKFRTQIKAGGPLTLTHPEITRYFMTMAEAAQLVIQACATNATHRLGAPVYLLDMGESVRIVDLAKSMVQLSGMKIRDEQHPEGEIELIFTGLRPGEKLYEELLISGHPLPTEHPQILIAQQESTQLNASEIDKLLSLCNSQSSFAQIQQALLQWSIGYTTASSNTEASEQIP